MFILTGSEKLVLLIVMKDFPHKRASLNEEVVKSRPESGGFVKSWRRSGYFLLKQQRRQDYILERITNKSTSREKNPKNSLGHRLDGDRIREWRHDAIHLHAWQFIPVLENSQNNSILVVFGLTSHLGRLVKDFSIHSPTTVKIKSLMVQNKWNNGGKEMTECWEV